jgi:hypothetical protein
VHLLRAGRYLISTRHLILVEDGDVPTEPVLDPDPSDMPQTELKPVPAGAIRFMLTWGRILVVTGETAKALRRQLEEFLAKATPPVSSVQWSGTVFGAAGPPPPAPPSGPEPPAPPPPKPADQDAEDDRRNGWQDVPDS